MSKRYWAAGWNMPGYLPEMEVAYFDDHTLACDFMRDEFENLAAGSTSEDWFHGLDFFSDLRDDYERLCDYGGGAYSAPDGYWYWIDEIDEETYQLNTEDWWTRTDDLMDEERDSHARLAMED